MKVIEIEHKITRDELKEMAARMFGDLVKAVVDVRKRIMAVDPELRSIRSCTLTRKVTCFKADQNRNTCGVSISILKPNGMSLLNSIR